MDELTEEMFKLMFQLGYNRGFVAASAGDTSKLPRDGSPAYDLAWSMATADMQHLLAQMRVVRT